MNGIKKAWGGAVVLAAGVGLASPAVADGSRLAASFAGIQAVAATQVASRYGPSRDHGHRDHHRPRYRHGYGDHHDRWRHHGHHRGHHGGHHHGHRGGYLRYHHNYGHPLLGFYYYLYEPRRHGHHGHHGRRDAYRRGFRQGFERGHAKGHRHERHRQHHRRHHDD